MGVVSRGFAGRGRSDPKLPPGQYLTEDFPVLSAGPTPRITMDRWEFVITAEAGQEHRWNWTQFRALPTETVTVDLHCVTKWSKLGTTWEGVSLDTLLSDVESVGEPDQRSEGWRPLTGLEMGDGRGRHPGPVPHLGLGHAP